MFKLQLDQTESCQQINVGFDPNKPAANQELVVYVAAELEKLIEDAPMRGQLLKINGACSLPIAALIVSKVASLYGAIAIYDPKPSGYVVSVTHNPDYQLGQLLEG